MVRLGHQSPLLFIVNCMVGGYRIDIIGQQASGHCFGSRETRIGRNTATKINTCYTDKKSHFSAAELHRIIFQVGTRPNSLLCRFVLYVCTFDITTLVISSNLLNKLFMSMLLLIFPNYLTVAVSLLFMSND